MKSTTILDSSRRNFLSRTAAMLGAGAAGAILANHPGSLLAQSTTPTTTTVTDLDVLQYALSLENLENAFYKGLSKFTANDFRNAGALAPFGTRVSSNVFTLLGEIGAHEQAHVDAISKVITSLGGTPAPACTYNFGYTTADDFLKVAMALENTGVTAYDGAIGLLTNPDIIQASATIATVEARHAAYLNLLNGAIPFPSAFDEARTMQQVLAIAGQFIVSCPVNPGSNPNAPTVSGVPATITTRENRVSFDASASKSFTGQAVAFSFTQSSGGNTSIIGGTTSTPTFVLLGGAGTYVFQAKITDQTGNVATRTITVTYTP